jgi:hypothetical protein
MSLSTQEFSLPQYYYFVFYKIVKLKLSLDQAVKAQGLWDVEAPTFSLDNRLTDGGKVVSLTRRSPITPKEDSWYSFLLEADSTPGP